MTADTMHQNDVMDPARAQAMEATLGLRPGLAVGDPLPAFFHQVYFWTALPADQLGRDGHPAPGQGIIPDLGLPRRMWAGGRMRFLAPLVLGQAAELVTDLVSASHKAGRSGPLGLVTIRLRVRQAGRLCIEEERDLIYREDPSPDTPPPKYPATTQEAQSRLPLRFDTTTLFRYSALTFNGHRIHYDLDYATGIEGYSGLVVHGPLLAQHLVRLAERDLGALKGFRFRATAPLMHFETARACRQGHDLWIEGPDGRLCMTATAET